MILRSFIRRGGRFLNLTSKEWSRVLPAFIVKLLFQVAFISGSTLAVALFLDAYSIEGLPVFFIFQSLLIIVGTSVVSGSLRRFPPSHLVMVGCGMASVGFIFAGYFYPNDPAIFFGVLLVSLSVCLAQVAIWISLFIENLFSPLESERAFPVIESSEPIGGIFAGLLLILLVGTFSTVQMIAVVGFVLACIPPVLLFSLRRLDAIPVLKVRRENRIRHRSERTMLKSTRRFFHKSRFVAGLFLVVFLQYSIVHLLEYQFSWAIDAQVRSSENYVYGPHQVDSHGHADSLSQHFGGIHIGIYSVLLLLQLLLAGKILQRLGVIRSYIVGPAFSLVAFVAMLFRFDFFTAIFARGAYDVGGGLSKNAFLHTFYALSEEDRDEAKETLEGIARPMGLLFGTVALVVLQNTVSSHILSASITVILICTSVISIILLARLRKHYSSVSREKFRTKDNLPERMNAIEILSQPGHKKAIEFLTTSLLEKDEMPEVKVKILQVIGRLEDVAAIPAIITCFKDPAYEVRLAAVEALGSYHKLGEKFFTQAFSLYTVQLALKELFLESRSTSIKIAAIKVFANLNDPKIIPFLLDAIQTDDPELLSECISVFGLFHDPGTISHLEPFLSETHDPRVRAAAVIALWQYEHLRPNLLAITHLMLNSPDIEILVQGIFVTGEIGNIDQKRKISRFMKHENYRVRRHAAIAMAKMNIDDAIEQLVEFLFYDEKEVGLKTKKLLKGVKGNILGRVEARSVSEVAHRVTGILEKAGTSFLENLRKNDLHELLHLFQLINAEQEIWKIRMILSERGELEPASG